MSRRNPRWHIVIIFFLSYRAVLSYLSWKKQWLSFSINNDIDFEVTPETLLDVSNPLAEN